MNYQENKQLWIQRVEDFRSSRLTQLSWCQKQNVNITFLRYWLRKLKEEELSDGKTEWVQLKVTENATSSQSYDASIAIHVGSFRVEVHEGFNPSVLQDVLKTLSVVC